MEGKVVLITGGTSGIGKSAATALAAMGAEVVVSGRNRERGEAALAEIRRASGNEKVSLMTADLAVQAEVRRLAEDLRERYDRLAVLVNNAGLIRSKRAETPDGMEMTLAVNHLAPFLLTNLLLDLLIESAPSRIITVSSEARRSARLDFDDADRSPGILLFRAFKPFMRTPEQGAETVIYLASSPEAGEMSGRYLMDRRDVSPAEPRGEAAQRRLWEVSEKLTRLEVPS